MFALLILNALKLGLIRVSINEGFIFRFLETPNTETRATASYGGLCRVPDSALRVYGHKRNEI